MTGVAALSERHVEESKRAKELIGELKKLRNSKLGHQSSLADLQREARANASSFADIQVMYVSMSWGLRCAVRCSGLCPWSIVVRMLC